RAEAHGPVRIVGQLSNLDVEPMLKSFGTSHAMSGRLSAQFDARGHGSEVEELKRTLNGKVTGRVEQARLLSFSFSDRIGSTLAGPLHLPTERLGRGTDLGTVNAELQIANGEIRLTQPVRAS